MIKETINKHILSHVISGAINWCLFGLFQFDLVAAIFGGQAAALSRVVYTLVGISGLFCLGMLFAPMGGEDRGESIRTGRVSYGMEVGEEPAFSDKNKTERK